MGIVPVCITNKIKNSGGGDVDFFGIMQHLNHAEVDASAVGRLLGRAYFHRRVIMMGHQHPEPGSVPRVWDLRSNIPLELSALF